MKKSDATNTFLNGLIMDLNPMVTPNTVLTNCLNGTLITYNGNENVLLNDMGNGRVETAFLPEGFIPIGTTQLGGIIYIVSYNPLTNQSLIGSFPSPERNILTTELGQEAKELSLSCFYNDDNIKNPRYKLLLLDKDLNPGDKFQIFAELDDNIPDLSAYGEKSYNINKLPKYLKLHIVSINKSGKIEYLDDNLVWYDDNGPYYINNKKMPDNPEHTDLDEYRGVVGANYSVFLGNSRGKLGILAELECIDSFNVSYDAVVTQDENNENKASINLYTNWTYDNPDKISKNLINLYGLKLEDVSENLEKDWEIETSLKDEDKDITLEYPKINDEEVLSFGDTDIKNNGENTYFLNFFKNLSEIFNSDPKLYPSSDKIFDYVKLGSLSLKQNYFDKLNNNNLLRKNNGQDNDFPINDAFTIEYTVPDDEENEENNKEEEVNKNPSNTLVKINVIPSMPFGYMPYLKKTLVIDVSKLGKGLTDLIEYKYYVNDKNLVLNWGLDSYPALGYEVKLVLFDFYELNEDLNDIFDKFSEFDNNGIDYIDGLTVGEGIKNYANQKSKKYIDEFNDPLDEKTPICRIIENNKSSYSGYFTNVIEYREREETIDPDNIPSSLYKNSCYLVKITIDYDTIFETVDENGEPKETKELRYYYRILYTVPVFNSKYFEEISDFSTINLFDVYKPHLEEEVDSSEILGKNKIRYKHDNGDADIENIYVIDKPNYENLRQENDFTWNVNKTYQLCNLNVLGFEYDNVFNEYKFESPGINDSEYDMSINENNLSIFSLDGTATLDEITLKSDKSPILKITSDEDKLIIESTDEEYINTILTPFFYEYSDNKISKTVNFVSDKLDFLLKDGNISGGKSITISSNSSELFTLNDGTKTYDTKEHKLKDWINDMASSYELLLLDWQYTEYGMDPDQGIILAPTHSLGTYTGTFNDSDPEPAGYKPDKNKVFLKTLIIKGDSNLFFFIIEYSKNSNCTNIVKNEDFLSFLRTLYKWKIAYNKQVDVYEMKNPTLYNDYRAILTINLEDNKTLNEHKFKLESYKIVDLEIKSDDIEKEPNKIPCNLKLKISDLSIPNIVGSYKVRTSSLKDILSNYNNTIYYDENTKTIYYNLNRSLPFIIKDNNVVQVRAISPKANVECVVQLQNDIFTITELNYTKNHDTNFYVWSEKKGNTKSWYSGGNGGTANGLLFIFENLILLAGDIKGESTGSGSGGGTTGGGTDNKGTHGNTEFEMVSREREYIS